MQHEIETAQKDLGAAEEKVLERMLEADELAARVKKAEAEHAATKKAIEAEKARMAEELTAVERALAEASTARDALVATMAGTHAGALRAGVTRAQGRGHLPGDARRLVLAVPGQAAPDGVPAGARQRHHRAVRQLPADPVLRAAAAARDASRHARPVRPEAPAQRAG